MKSTALSVRKSEQILFFGIFNFRIRHKIEMHPSALNGFIESTFARMMDRVVAQVPFAEHPGRVTGIFHGLSDRDFFQRKLCDVIHRPKGTAAPIETVDVSDRINTGARHILSAHERGASRLAVWPASMAVSKADALTGKPVNV